MSILSDYKATRKKEDAPIRNPAYDELKQIVIELQEVLDDKEIEWEEKYDLIFSTHQKQVKDLLKAAYLRLDYYDPDTSYEDDVRAYVSALESLVEKECQ